MAECHDLSMDEDEEDLIDFNVGSAEVAKGVLENTVKNDVSETLLDSELVRLEETLQSAHAPVVGDRRKSTDSVELEQILITIEDDDAEVQGVDDDDVEMLIVLNELDRILNVHDETELKQINEEEQCSIEECLRDLDDYLKSYASDSEDFPTVEQTNDDDQIKKTIERIFQRTNSLGNEWRHKKSKILTADWCTLARDHKFRASISALKRDRNKLTSNPNESTSLKRKFARGYSSARSKKKSKPKCSRRATISSVDTKNQVTQNSTDTTSNNIEFQTEPIEDNNESRTVTSNEIDSNLITEPTTTNNELESEFRSFKTNTEINPRKSNRSDPEIEPKRKQIRTNSETQSKTNLRTKPVRTKSVVESRRPNFQVESGTKSLRINPKSRTNFQSNSSVSNEIKINPTVTPRPEVESKNMDVEIRNSNRTDLGNGSDIEVDRRVRVVRRMESEDGFIVPVRSNAEAASNRPSGSERDNSRNSSVSLSEIRVGADVYPVGSKFSSLRVSELKRGDRVRSTIGTVNSGASCSAPRVADSDEEIDWNWVRDVNKNPSSGRTDDKPNGNSTWLRTSMRRVQHFRLPSDPTPAVITTSIPIEIESESVRPSSAPQRIEPRVEDRRQPPISSSESGRSRTARSLSSSESSLASTIDSGTCTPTPNPVQSSEQTRRQCDRPVQSSSSMPPESPSPLGQWPHSLSSMLAIVGCTLGLFNVCRFAVLSVHFGANFIIQFLLMSVIFGIPLFTLQLCLGQQLGAGVIDMWRISPLFQGVGVALLLSQAMLGIYSVVGVSWMFIYFRDSFITKTDQYRWAQDNNNYDPDVKMNETMFKITETVPEYFSGVVLQRHNLLNGSSFGAVKFQVAFNLAVVWMIVFVSLSKGLRSYAKVVYVFSLLPIFGTFVLCAKLLGMTPDSIHEVFPETSWAEFFLNTKSWLAASQEAFLTWGLLGAAAMQLASHNKHRNLLQRDSSFIIILTITILMLTAFLANTCVEILHAKQYNYLPDSFENQKTYIFLRSKYDPLPPSLTSTPIRYMSHSSFVIGERVQRPGMDKATESGYQVLRFATELVPATLALLGPNQISPFWAVLFYFVLILFGIAQQLAIWHCVITGIMAIKSKVLKSWETTITFFTCTFGFILGLPMTTEMGIYVVYFLDYCIGGVWWLILVYLIQVIAVFMVRGRPYSGDTVVTALFTDNNGSFLQSWLAPLLSFTWNVILPVALMVVCIALFRTSNFRELFIWHHALNLDYWPIWTKQLGCLIQLTPLLCIPAIAIIQSYRYLNNGPSDILEEPETLPSPYRIQLLYRPPMNSEHLDDTLPQQAATIGNDTAITTIQIPAEDPPPKYTPPPSYTTATGARIAKLLRQSIRRSMRRITSVLGESSASRTENATPLPPPDYSTVLVEMNQSTSSQQHTRQESRTSQELAAFRGSTLTAADVASILRSSFRRSTVRTLRRNLQQNSTEQTPSGSISNQNLIDNIAPVSVDTLSSDEQNKITNNQ